MVFGIAGALLVAIVQATLADRHGTLAPAAIVEANAFATLLGAAAPFAVALAILAGSDWRVVFVVAALLVVPALGIAYGSVCSPQPRSLRMETSPSCRVRTGSTGGHSSSSSRSSSRSSVWSTDYLESVQGLSASRAAAASSLFLVGMTVGRVVGGWLAKRFEPARILSVALALAALGFLVFWLAPSGLSVVGLGLTGCGVSVLYPLTLALAIAASGGRTDAASVRAGFAAGAAIAIAPFVLGAFADAAGLRAAYTVVPVLIVLGAAALVAAMRLSTP